MIMQTNISITAIALCACYLLFLYIRKGRMAVPLPLSAAILTAAALELFDLLALINPADLMYWKKYSLAVESLLPPIWLWFTLTYARQNDIRSVSLWQRLLFAASPLFAASVLLIPVTSFFYSPD